MGIMSLLLSLVEWVRSSLLLLSPYASPARPRDHAGSLRSFPLWEEHNDEVVRNRKGEQRGREGTGREGGDLRHTSSSYFPSSKVQSFLPPSVLSSLPLVMYKTYKWHTGALVSSGWGWIYPCSCVPSQRVKC